MGTDANFYSADYVEARTRFREAVAAGGGKMARYDHPSECASDGSPLSIDVGRIGPDDAKSVAMILSGTHGQEGFAGGAAQLALLDEIAANGLPQGVRLVLVHGVNPWGWANLSRTTEDNIDLNRNFVSFDEALSSPPLYKDMNEILTLRSPIEPMLEAAWPAIEAMMVKHGPKLISDTMAGGQYHYPDGMNYGGARPAWSNDMVRKIVGEHVLPADRVALLDWHTGIGAHGAPFFFCFHERGSPEFERACAWWGKAHVDTSDVGAGMPAPKYTGLLFHGVIDALGGVPVTGSVIEFGTYPIPEMAKALMVDQWLKFGEPDRQEADHWRTWMVERFCPAGAAWRTSTMGHARVLQRQMLDGLAAWRT